MGRWDDIYKIKQCQQSSQLLDGNDNWEVLRVDGDGTYRPQGRVSTYTALDAVRRYADTARDGETFLVRNRDTGTIFAFKAEHAKVQFERVSL